MSDPNVAWKKIGEDKSETLGIMHQIRCGHCGTEYEVPDFMWKLYETQADLACSTCQIMGVMEEIS